MNNIDEDSSRSDLATACSEEDYCRARELLATGSDPATSRAGYFNWSPLHYTARQGQLEFAQMLISQYGCHPQVEDKEGRTPLHIACQYGQLEFVQYLIQQKRCDASYLDIEDQTPLHHTCGWLSECTEEKAMAICQFLISRAKCDPNQRDVNGKSAVLHACEKGFLSILKYFIEERNCDLSAVDYKGNNTLHLAVSFSNNSDVVDYILKKKVLDLETVNNQGNNVVHMAAIANASLDICKLILDQNTGSLIEAKNESGSSPLYLANGETQHFILTRFHVQSKSFYDKFASSLGVKQSPVSHVRIFVVGDSKSGKTTLIQSLKRESSSLSSSFSLSFSSHSPVPPLVEESRGVTITLFESKTCGHITFYDFSGHSNYASIQESVLRHSIHPALSIFIVVVNHCKSSQEIHSSLHHWLGFLSRSWNEVAEPLRVIIVGNIADAIKSSGKTIREKLNFIAFETLKSSFGNFEVVSKIQIDCHKAEHSGVSALRKQLSSMCSKMERESNLSFSACCLFTYLTNNFESSLAMKVQTLVTNVRAYTLKSGPVSDVRYFLSDDVSILIRLLDSLDKAGHVTFLKNEGDIEQSLVIIQGHELFSDVTKLWNQNPAPPINDQNLVSLSAISALFPEQDYADILLHILLHFKLCTEVNESVTRSNRSPTEVTKQFYFPSLLPNSAPACTWDMKCSYKYNYGWLVETSERGFSQHLIDVTLLCSLSKSTSVMKLEDMSLWRNGFYLRANADGEFEVLVEAFNDLKAIVLISRAQTFSTSCLAYRSTVTKEIRQCLNEYGVQYLESLMDPFDTRRYPLPSKDMLTLFSIPDIVSSIQSGNLAIDSNERVKIPLNDLLYFEPFASVGRECLTALSAACSTDLIPDKFLLLMARALATHAKRLEIFMSILSICPTDNTDDKVYNALLSWQNSNNRTYSEFVNLLAEFSLFEISNFHLATLSI